MTECIVIVPKSWIPCFSMNDLRNFTTSFEKVLILFSKMKKKEIFLAQKNSSLMFSSMQETQFDYLQPKYSNNRIYNF